LLGKKLKLDKRFQATVEEDMARARGPRTVARMCCAQTAR
jgi:hypothetical protein